MDIEKIVEAFAKRGLVPPLHFHEGAQIHDNNIDKLILGGETQPKLNTQPTVAMPTDVSDELLTALKGDMSLYQDVVAKAKFIVCASDFRSVLRPVFDSHGFNIRSLNKKQFFAAYIPFLSNYVNKKCAETMCHTTFL